MLPAGGVTAAAAPEAAEIPTSFAALGAAGTRPATKGSAAESDDDDGKPPERANP
jgi:hypothetical protein